MKQMKIGLLCLLSLLILGACSMSNNTSKKNSEREQLSIVTTFYPIYDFTKNIVGDEGNVELLIPAGTEPHDFEPSAKEIAHIHDADVFIYHNENMETWVATAEESWSKNEPRVIKGTKDIILLPESEKEHDHHHDEEDHHHELDRSRGKY